MQTLWQDLRYGVHMLMKNPGFTAVAVLTLALGIGANAVVFSILNALILHPLHLPNENSLYGIQHGNEASSYQSYADYIDLRDRNRTFEDIAAYNPNLAALDTGENTTSAWMCEVSGNYFDVLGVQPYLGRVFHSSDEHGAGSAPYLVLSYAYWHTHFQDDRRVVGRVVQLNKRPYTIVGVAPPEFRGTLVFFPPAFYTPIVNTDRASLETRGRRWVFMTMGHLKSGVTPEQAVADLNSVGEYLQKTYPKDDDQRTFALARPGLYGDYLGRPVKAFMTGLMTLAGLILLAACANLGSLFAARAADRSREVALRLALGASRGRILRQLFTEAVLLSAVGGAVGIWASVIVLSTMSTWQPIAKWPMQLTVNPDANVYGVAVLLSLASGFLFGAVPIRQVMDADPYEIIKSGTTARAGRRFTIRDFALGLQIALCALLVTSSFVAIRGLARTMSSNFGFEPRGAMLADTDLHIAGYSDETTSAMQKKIIEALRTIPGVNSVGFINEAPLAAGGFNGTLVFHDDAVDLKSSSAVTDSFVFGISPDYFEASGTPLLTGRTITWHDDQNAPRVGVINELLARKAFGSATNAMSKYFKTKDGTRIQVVGVVEDGKYQRVMEEQQSAMFLPILQSPSSESYFVVRSDRDAAQLTTAIRNTVRALDAGLALYIQPWDKEMETALFASRMAALALGILGAMGAMLSITGVFGMAAHSVTKRLKELGIRMALGAQWKEVLKAALGRTVRLLAFGSAAGLLLGLLASRVLALVVYSATPRDPLVLAGVVLAMAVLGLVATWIPAQRAMSIDPAKLMREE